MIRSVLCIFAAGITGTALLYSPACTHGQDADQPAAATDAAAKSEQERTYPSLPGAVRHPPKWVTQNAPFDVTRLFDVVPPDENAAPLYLDALYEFSPGDMQSCIAPEEKAARGPKILERAMRTGNLMVADQLTVTPAERALIVAEYAEAFEMLVRAQQRKKCVFETGIGITSLLPHAQSARQVVRLLDWRVEALVAEGKIDAALDDIATALRLSSDLRPRGFAISQLVSFALDGVVTASLVPKVLAAPNLTIEHCDRLLEMATRHLHADLDPLLIGLRMEYVMCRDVIHQAESKADPTQLSELSEATKATLEEMTPADFLREVERLNQYFEPMIGEKAKSLPGPIRLQPDQQTALDEMKVVKDFQTAIPQVIEAARRDRTRLTAMQCQAALRRWQLKSKNANPPDLHVLCKDVGIPVPIDEYSETGESLRSTLITGEFVIYSVGSDGKDDGGRVDWKFGQQPGDWIFRLSAP